MEIENQVKYYDNLWNKRLQLNSLQLRRAVKVLDYFVDIKRALKKPKVLELGCGDGRFTAFIGEFADTDAIELSEDAIRIARENHPHVNFFQGSVLEYDFEEGIYDVVISQEVIEHIDDQQKYLEVCAKVLKSGGTLIMTTPNRRVFDHMIGGNWSQQPVEKIMNPKEFKALISKMFKIKKYDSIIMNFGTMSYFKLLNHKLIIGGCKQLGLVNVREFVLSKLGFGLHQCVLAIKK
jgi:2-polyprenyl-3-methyl-5-hydroxy-6-metoxy-1,4-benzoquinol methylase